MDSREISALRSFRAVIRHLPLLIYKKLIPNNFIDTSIYEIDRKIKFRRTLEGIELLKICFSGKNIPARCHPVKIPIDILDGTEVCVRIFDIFTPKLKAIHACVALQVLVPDFPAVEVQVACVQAGVGGVSLIKD